MSVAQLDTWKFTTEELDRLARVFDGLPPTQRSKYGLRFDQEILRANEVRQQRLAREEGQ
jgi:hypothetical protein